MAEKVENIKVNQTVKTHFTHKKKDSIGSLPPLRYGGILEEMKLQIARLEKLERVRNIYHYKR